ncbi:hypothetical protein Tco_0430824 [Tanacetum coccineum]
MSSPNHPTSDIEDAFSSNFPDYIPASLDYVPASPGKTYSSSSNNSFGVVPIVSPTLSLFHDDPYMKVMHAYYAKESPIPPPTIVPPSTMLSPMFNPQSISSIHLAKPSDEDTASGRVIEFSYGRDLAEKHTQKDKGDDYHLTSGEALSVYEEVRHTAFCLSLVYHEILRLNPTTLGESFFKACIIEGCFEDKNNRTFNNNVGDQEDPNMNDKQEVKRLMKILVLMSLEEVVMGCGEAFRVDDDELNRVISVLKDGGGEFDDCLDGINLDLSQDFVIKVLESKDVSGRSLVIFLKWVYRVKSRGAAKGGRRVLCYVQGSGRRKKKQIEAAIQRRLWDTGIKSDIQGNTLRASLRKSTDSDINSPYLKTSKNLRPLPDFEEYAVSTSVDTPFRIQRTNTPYWLILRIRRTNTPYWSMLHIRRPNTPYWSIRRIQKSDMAYPNQLKKIMEYFIRGAHSKSSNTSY